jgi:hypothetical protein
MRHKLAVVVGVGAAILVAGFPALLHVEGRREPSEHVLEPVPSRATVGVEVRNPVVENSGAASSPTNAVPLRELSPSFRHSTFLVAIRNAGFYCDDVVAAQETGEGIWIANCTDTRAYRLSARLTDALRVEPIYYDAPLRSPPVRLELPR